MTPTPKQIRDWRKAHKYTQTQFAVALGVDVSTVQRWESGTTAPAPYLRQALLWLDRTARKPGGYVHAH